MVISLCYGPLYVSIGLDEASCAGRRFSPVDIYATRAEGSSAEVPSERAAFLGNDRNYILAKKCRVGGMVLCFSLVRRV